MEQMIIEAAEQGKQGFRNGWASTMMLEVLFDKQRIAPNRKRDLLLGLGYMVHPRLNDGRTNDPVLPDNGKTRLYVKPGHSSLTLQTAAEVAKQYEKDQK
jgi:hypothetical protein